MGFTAPMNRAALSLLYSAVIVPFIREAGIVLFFVFVEQLY